MEDNNLAEEIAKENPKWSFDRPTFGYSSVLKKPERWTALDLARGFAIILMILSHCVKGLMYPSRIPDWGVIPVHLMTKFSSSLFIVVFGVSLSLYFVPHIAKKSWSRKRNWMLKRGIELMIWYKLLIVVQMFQYYPKSMIIDTLMFRTMPDFVEILCFYAIALLWLPFVLPLWSRLNFISKGVLILGTLFLGQWLHYNFDFWGINSLKAILVEQKGYYTFGQLQRGALIFFGLFIGDLFKWSRENHKSESHIPLLCVGMGGLGLGFFFLSNYGKILSHLDEIAHNVGKHPFNLNFFCFSVGGALVILGICMLMSNQFRRALKPFTYIGQHSLNAFILHIVIIFYFYRYFFGLHHKVTYMQSLGLTAACCAAIIFIMFLWSKLKTKF